MIVNFSAYSFIKRENATWISLGCIKDDSVGDAVQYNFGLPVASSEEPSKAEVGAVYHLAETVKMILPVGPDTHVTWKVTSQEVKDLIEADADIILRLADASTTFEVGLMEPEIQEAAFKEINSVSLEEAESWEWNN